MENTSNRENLKSGDTLLLFMEGKKVFVQYFHLPIMEI
jgi:hypothetical protein